MSAEIEYDIKIWTVTNGTPTEIKVNDVIIPISGHLKSGTDVIKTATDYFNVFGYPKTIPYVQTECKTTDKTTSDVIKDDPDIAGTYGKNYIKYSTLETIYESFNHTAFTCNQIVEKFRHTRGFGYTNVMAHIKYLLERKWIMLYGITKPILYIFIVNCQEWEHKFIDIEYNSSRDNIIECDPNILSSDYECPIRRDVLELIYENFSENEFTTYEVTAKLNAMGVGRANGWYMTHIKYLKDHKLCITGASKKYAKYKLTPNFRKVYDEWKRAPVKNTQWWLDKSGDCTVTPDVPDKQENAHRVTSKDKSSFDDACTRIKQTINFDQNEARYRRGLELETYHKMLSGV